MAPAKNPGSIVTPFVNRFLKNLANLTNEFAEANCLGLIEFNVVYKNGFFISYIVFSISPALFFLNTTNWLSSNASLSDLNKFRLSRSSKSLISNSTPFCLNTCVCNSSFFIVTTLFLFPWPGALIAQSFNAPFALSIKLKVFFNTLFLYDAVKILFIFSI